MAIFTKEILNQGKSRNGFWSNKQLKVLGLTEIKKGWKHIIIGKELPDEVIVDFLNLKDKHLDKKDHTNSSFQKLYKFPTKPNHLILTEEILNEGKSRNGAWSAAQLKVFGIIEIKKGWKQKILGEEFSIGAINRFLQLKDKHLEEIEPTVLQINYDSMSVVNLDIPIEEQYRHKNWLDLRKVVLQRDNYACTICKIKYVELHVHHMVYPKGKFIWEIEQNYLVVVCKKCHERIHDKALNIAPNNDLP